MSGAEAPGRAIYYCPEIWTYLRAAHERAGTDADRHTVPYELLSDRERWRLNHEDAGALDCQGHTVLTFFWGHGAHPFEHPAHDHLRLCSLCAAPLVKVHESEWPVKAQ